MMKEEYDFSKARRGPVVKLPPGKTRITIRIDTDTLNWFREQVHKRGGGSYQTLMNEALREYAGSRERNLEKTVRKVIKEELRALKKA
jgi:uncharacterized protein (DUF4415 family)